MNPAMSADEARSEIETWLTFSAENRPGDGDRMGVSYERAPLRRSSLRALLDQNARLLAEPSYIWTYNDDDGENCSEPYATEAGARADAEEEYVDNAYIDPANAGVLTWVPLPQNPGMQVLYEDGKSVGVHLWRSKVIGGGPAAAEVERLKSAVAEKVERIRLARTEIMRVGLIVLPDQPQATQDVLRAALRAIETPLLAETQVVADV